MLTTIYRCESGHWVTNLLNNVHYVQFEPQDICRFNSLNLHPAGAVTIELTTHGIIESITLVKTGEQVNYIDIPKNHHLSKEIKMGRPYANEISSDARICA